jgi:hypothetical protein
MGGGHVKTPNISLLWAEAHKLMLLRVTDLVNNCAGPLNNNVQSSRTLTEVTAHQRLQMDHPARAADAAGPGK